MLNIYEELDLTVILVGKTKNYLRIFEVSVNLKNHHGSDFYNSYKKSVREMRLKRSLNTVNTQ